ncbi:hypothetical protein [Pseudoxanthomonas putridarboris]|uniref:Transposase n=1 Tax=Pseudoxanthomonas putridarboris TaxID=752605 RepID=A0ABU9IZB7_9GAMM
MNRLRRAGGFFCSTMTPARYFAGQRSRRWRGLLDEALTEEDLSAIREYLQQQRTRGRDGFRAVVEAETRCFAGVRPAHRPSRPGK